LLYPEFKEMASAFTEKHVPVHLTTNGAMTMEAYPLLCSLSSIYFSLDACSPKTYRQIRGGDYYCIRHNIRDLARDFKGETLAASFVRRKENRHEEQQFLDFWLNTVGIDSVIFYSLFKFNGDGTYSIDGQLIESPKHRIVCSSPWLECYVYPNGDVSLCCQSLLMTGRYVPIMGNIREQSLAEIWKGEWYRMWRKALLTEDWFSIPFCRYCPLWFASYAEKETVGAFKVTRNMTTEIIERREKK
jgi:MoaA/NifB/PqqE/SkfB family radical SAM enzyme